jgi:hypothetical protein
MSYSPDSSATHEYTPHQYQLLTPAEVTRLDGEVQALQTMVRSIQELSAAQRRASGVRHLIEVLDQEIARVSELLSNHRSTPQVSDESNLFS